MPHCNCNWVRRCVVGTAFRLAQIHSSLVEGRPPDGRLLGSHQPQERPKVRYIWLDDENGWNGDERNTPHLDVQLLESTMRVCVC